MHDFDDDETTRPGIRPVTLNEMLNELRAKQARESSEYAALEPEQQVTTQGQDSSCCDFGCARCDVAA